MFAVSRSLAQCLVPRSTTVSRRIRPSRAERLAAVQTDEAQEFVDKLSSIQSAGRDPFNMASRRLSNVLQEVGVHVDEQLVSSEVADYPAEAKLTVCTNMASFATLGAIAVCWFCGEDPLGGLTLSEGSMHAAMVGVAYGMPLVACSGLSRIPIARFWFPVLEDLHTRQARMLAPLVTGLTPQQMLILNVCTVVPVLMCLLPAMKGGLDLAMLILYVSSIQPSGIHISSSVASAISTLLPLLASAYLAGWMTMEKLAVKQNEYSAIKTALTNSKQHFHVLAMNARSTSSESQQAAEAFKMISVLWLMSRIKTAQLGYVLSALTIAYYGVMWEQTGDLATPAMAAFLHFLLEFYFIHREVNKGQVFMGQQARQVE